MADLVDTLDPRELIPGNPDALRAAAAHWQRMGDAVESTGQGLASLDTGPWDGPAAQAATTARQNELPRWTGAGDALRSSGVALARHADVVEWGQGQAAEAAGMWQQANGSPQLQAQATDLLDRARDQVRQSGDDTTLAVQDAPIERGPTKAGPDPIDHLVDLPLPTTGAWDNVESDHPSQVEVDRGYADHILRTHGNESKVPDKSVFPANWDDRRTIENTLDVARNPTSVEERTDPDGNVYYVCRGERDGVRMEVVTDQDGNIKTSYPVGGQGVQHNDEDGNRIPPSTEQERRDQEAAEQERHAEEEKQAAEDERRQAEEQGREADEREQQAEQERQQAEQAGDQEAEQVADAEQEEADREQAEAQEREAEAHEREQQADAEYDNTAVQNGADYSAGPDGN
ncbi:putative T7SS-secreted protein [Actinocrispum wychmicini]|uniref:EndoU nuclease-like protein n=1 Tax=Actinocrispum wychmicini TaxID=1213861 RepID=A0A4R2J7I9_9PSEU|nr:EndoU domain-containing protein [Actinocrispum wychmicini]TCO54107.1 EndoU nuclease-like protein [Actinocrispum wychmicini]